MTQVPIFLRFISLHLSLLETPRGRSFVEKSSEVACMRKMKDLCFFCFSFSSFQFSSNLLSHLIHKTPCRVLATLWGRKKLKLVSISRQKEGAPLIWWSEEDGEEKWQKQKSATVTVFWNAENCVSLVTAQLFWFLAFQIAIIGVGYELQAMTLLQRLFS